MFRLSHFGNSRIDEDIVQGALSLIEVIPGIFQEVQNQKEKRFGREGLLVKVWWFKTVFGIRDGTRGTKDHWVIS